MYNRLITFFLRRKFGLKKFEKFVFSNQISKVNRYYFTEDCLMKIDVEQCEVRPANVRLNWLLDKRCKIISKERSDD